MSQNLLKCELRLIPGKNVLFVAKYPYPEKVEKGPHNLSMKRQCWSGEAGHGVGIWHFSKIYRQSPCTQANHLTQMHKNFLALISFIRVAMVREKSGKNKNFSRSGKSQGIFQKVRELCFLAQCIKVGNAPLKAKLNLSERFQPDGVFHFWK